MPKQVLQAALLSAFLTLSGCEWDPPHDNPLDSTHPDYQPVGKLRIHVQTNIGRHIQDATVLLNKEGEQGRFSLTGGSGEAFFTELPVGNWLAVAFRDVVPDTIYERDSLMVTVNQAAETDTSIYLDALPFFESTAVNAITEGPSQNEAVSFLRMTARVNDPDGPGDLWRINWNLLDIIRGSLEYRPDPDSAYWWAEMPSDSFPTGNLESVRTLPFTFEAVDRDTNSSVSNPTYLARVIDNIPELETIADDIQPVKIRWFYTAWDEEFGDTLLFNYLVRIYSLVQEPVVVYDFQISD